jgi:hypothetical protein
MAHAPQTGGRRNGRLQGAPENYRSGYPKAFDRENDKGDAKLCSSMRNFAVREAILAILRKSRKLFPEASVHAENRSIAGV